MDKGGDGAKNKYLIIGELWEPLAGHSEQVNQLRVVGMVHEH